MNEQLNEFIKQLEYQRNQAMTTAADLSAQLISLKNENEKIKKELIDAELKLDELQKSFNVDEL